MSRRPLTGNEYTCDRCQRTALGDDVSPDGWVVVPRDPDDVDLCPSCAPAALAWIDDHPPVEHPEDGEGFVCTRCPGLVHLADAVYHYDGDQCIWERWLCRPCVGEMAAWATASTEAR